MDVLPLAPGQWLAGPRPIRWKRSARRCKACGAAVYGNRMYCSSDCRSLHVNEWRDEDTERQMPPEVIRQRCLAIQEEWDDETRNIRSWCREKEWAPPACAAAAEFDEPSRYDELADLGEALRWAASHRRQYRKLRPFWIKRER